MSEEQVIQQLDIVIRAKYKDALKDIDNAISSMKQKVQQSKKGLEFGANTDGLRNAKQQIQNYSKSVVTTTARQEQLLRKINDIKATLSIANGELGQNEITDLKAELEKLTEQYNKLTNGTKNAKNETNGFGLSFSDLWKKIKIGTVALLGARSAFSLFRRGMQSAVSVNKQLQSQQEITTNALGQLFVPAMKVALNVLQYLIIGIAEVIRLFTGWDAISKVTSKSLSDTNKNAKALNKTLSSIDEIENLNDDNGSGLGSSYASDLKALGDLQEKVKKVRELFDKWNIPEKIDKIKSAWNKGIKPILDWLWEHPEVITTVFGVFLSGKLLSSIGGIIGNKSLGTGLLGMLGTLGVLTAGAYIVSVGIQISKDLEEFKKNDAEFLTGKRVERVIEFTANAKGLDDIKKAVATINANSVATVKRYDSMFGDKSQAAERFKTIAQQSGLIVENTLAWYKAEIRTADEQREMLDNLRETRDMLEYNLLFIEEGTDEYRATENALKKVNDAIKTAKYEYMGMPTLAEQFSNKINATKNAIYNSITQPINLVKSVLSSGLHTFLNVDTSNAMSKISSLFTSLSSGFANSSVGKILSGLTTKGTVIKNKTLEALASLGIKFQAKGNVAYGTTLGITGEYQNVRSNPEITSPQNIMAETFSDVLANYLPYMNSGNSGDAIFYLNGKEFAKAVYSDIENESTRRGSSMTIKAGV